MSSACKKSKNEKKTHCKQANTYFFLPRRPASSSENIRFSWLNVQPRNKSNRKICITRSTISAPPIYRILVGGTYQSATFPIRYVFCRCYCQRPWDCHGASKTGEDFLRKVPTYSLLPTCCPDTIRIGLLTKHSAIIRIKGPCSTTYLPSITFIRDTVMEVENTPWYLFTIIYVPDLWL